MTFFNRIFLLLADFSWNLWQDL